MDSFAEYIIKAHDCRHFQLQLLCGSILHYSTHNPNMWFFMTALVIILGFWCYLFKVLHFNLVTALKLKLKLNCKIIITLYYRSLRKSKKRTCQAYVSWIFVMLIRATENIDWDTETYKIMTEFSTNQKPKFLIKIKKDIEQCQTLTTRAGGSIY